MIDNLSIIAIWLSSSPLRSNDGFQIEFFMCACVCIHISRGIHVCAFDEPLGEEKTKEILLVSESVFSVYAIIYFQNRKTS